MKAIWIALYYPEQVQDTDWNRPVWSRTQGGVGLGGESLPGI
jgi:hypothetical protein